MVGTKRGRTYKGRASPQAAAARRAGQTDARLTTDAANAGRFLGFTAGSRGRPSRTIECPEGTDVAIDAFGKLYCRGPKTITL